MMHHVIFAATSSTERFTVLLVFLTALLGAVSMVVRQAMRIGRAVVRQIEALESNTVATRDLAMRVENLEASHRVS